VRTETAQIERSGMPPGHSFTAM